MNETEYLVEEIEKLKKQNNELEETILSCQKEIRRLHGVIRSLPDPVEDNKRVRKNFEIRVRNTMPDSYLTQDLPRSRKFTLVTDADEEVRVICPICNKPMKYQLDERNGHIIPVCEEDGSFENP